MLRYMSNGVCVLPNAQALKIILRLCYLITVGLTCEFVYNVIMKKVLFFIY